MFLDVFKSGGKWRRAKLKLKWGLYYAIRIGEIVAGINFISTSTFISSIHPKYPRGKVRIGKTLSEPGYLLLRYF